MTNAPKTIQIKQADSFKTDKVFASAREEINKKSDTRWKEIIEKKPVPNDSEISIMDSVVFHDDCCQIIIDARGYRPENINCSISNNGVVDIISKKEEKDGAKSSARVQTRNYNLPRNVKTELSNCFLSTEGILVITVPWSN